MADVKMPRGFKVSGKATEAARAARNPNFVAPKDAAVTTDKNGVEYKRWIETGTIEFAYREGSKDNSQVVYVVAIKPRPGEPNQNKLGWFRMMIHPDIAEGREVSPEIEASFGWLTERALVNIVSLIDVTGFTPKKEGEGLSESLLNTLFPLKQQKSKGQLIGKSVAVKIVQQKNKPPYDQKKEYQENPELFLPPVPLAALPEKLQ